MIYYELLPDNTIGRSTPSEKIAKDLGLALATDKEIVYGYNGKRYFKGEEPITPEPTYVEKRIAEYPSITDQLDMIYWDKVKNTNLWQAKITEIKAKYPKI
jgi:hypothetical protein